jgi:hypothetical protein
MGKKVIGIADGLPAAALAKEGGFPPPLKLRRTWRIADWKKTNQPPMTFRPRKRLLNSSLLENRLTCFGLGSNLAEMAHYSRRQL